MTRRFPDRVSNVGDSLARTDGSYLHSVVSGDWAACCVCALPVEGHRLCPQCQVHQRSGSPLADRAGFLVYADEPASQTYRVMRGYKEARTRRIFEPVVQALLAVGLRGHFRCAEMLARARRSGWAIVPSTRGRSALVDLARGLTKSPESEIQVSLAGSRPDRQLRPASWVIDSGPRLPEHVVIIDDSWVSGASSQSLAGALKQRGVTQISILSVARVLSPQWEPNRTFLRDVLPTLAYDWTICPWTGAECP